MSHPVKKAVSRARILQRLLKMYMKVDHPLTGENEVVLSIEEQLHCAQIAKGLKGDTNAYKAIMDNAYPEKKEPIVQLNIDPSTLDDAQLEHTIKQLQTIQDSYAEETADE